MITSLALMSIHKAPAIPLADICERYFALSYEEALKKAARNELPVPTFRLTVDDHIELTRRDRLNLTHPQGYPMAASCSV